MSNYSKNLSGLNQKVVVSPQIEYTDDTTYAGFIANAPEGEIGVFLDDGAVRTTALTTGLKFFVAQKRDGNVNKSPVIEWDQLFRKKYTAYDAPVKKVVTVGYNGTSGDIGLDFTGASLTNALTFGVTARETTPANQPFPVQEGYATVTSSTADEYTVLAAIVSQLNADYDYERVQPDRFVIAEILSNGTKTNLTNGAVVVNLSTTVTSTAHGLSVGALIELRDVVYKVVAVPDVNTLTIDRPYQGVSETIGAGANAASIAYTSGTTLLGVRLTAIEVESHFVAQGNYSLQTAPVTVITAWKLGSGSGKTVRELESREGIIFDGLGSTVNAAFKEDYGQPSLFSSLSLTYNLFFLDFAPKLIPAAGLPVYEQKQIERILIAAPSSGASPSNELQTIFGL